MARGTRFERRRARHLTLRQLQCYLDGEADADVFWHASRHLAACDVCFSSAEQYRTLQRAIRGLRNAPDPQAMVNLRRLVAALPGSASEA